MYTFTVFSFTSLDVHLYIFISQHYVSVGGTGGRWQGVEEREKTGGGVCWGPLEVASV
jgi:hypothetical protein